MSRQCLHCLSAESAVWGRSDLPRLFSTSLSILVRNNLDGLNGYSVFFSLVWSR